MIPKKGNGIAMLQDRIAELEAEVERLKNDLAMETTLLYQATEHGEHIAQERDQLRSALEKCQENLRIYGIHNEDCELGMAILEDYGIGEADCTCGLDALKGGE